MSEVIETDPEFELRVAELERDLRDPAKSWPRPHKKPTDFCAFAMVSESPFDRLIRYLRVVRR